jgi:DNA polymerase
MKKTARAAFIRYGEILRDYEDLLGGDFRLPREPEVPIKIIITPSAAPSATGSPGGDVGELPASRARLLDALYREVLSCGRCRLSEGRAKAVPGTGVLDPLVMVIGEGPGAEEDREGLPFIGAAGKFLDKWLAAIGLSRDTNVYIANIVKCRPPGNRDPNPDETAACRPYLERQIEIVRPRTILAVGRIAAQNLLGSAQGIGAVRGKRFTFRGVPMTATYHPSAVLRDMGLKRPVWEDLKTLKEMMDEKA